EGTEYPVTRYRLATGGVFVLVTDGVVEGPSLSVDEGLERVVRLASLAAAVGMEADALAAAVLKNAELIGHEDDAAVLVVGHDGRGATRGVTP
ncbi:SpoIIE family protein phosphatase, partial [Streptomyces sp. SID5926]|nr:SpoIIE family protein phosphatase [Streptomyces sp. SID5926]